MQSAWYTTSYLASIYNTMMKFIKTEQWINTSSMLPPIDRIVRTKYEIHKFEADAVYKGHGQWRTLSNFSIAQPDYWKPRNGNNYQ